MNAYSGEQTQCGEFAGTFVLLRCLTLSSSLYIHLIGYSSSVWGSASNCHLQLLESQVRAVARLCGDCAST